MSNPMRPCHHRTLARNSVAHIQRCGRWDAWRGMMGEVDVGPHLR
jgi:hypothetical protein